MCDVSESLTPTLFGPKPLRGPRATRLITYTVAETEPGTIFEWWTLERQKRSVLNFKTIERERKEMKTKKEERIYCSSSFTKTSEHFLLKVSLNGVLSFYKLYVPQYLSNIFLFLLCDEYLGP